MDGTGVLVEASSTAFDLQEFDPEMTASPEGDSGLSEVGSGEK